MQVSSIQTPVVKESRSGAPGLGGSDLPVGHLPMILQGSLAPGGRLARVIVSADLFSISKRMVDGADILRGDSPIVPSRQVDVVAVGNAFLHQEQGKVALIPLCYTRLGCSEYRPD